MGLWVHVSDTREHRLYEREASRAPSRELKCVPPPQKLQCATKRNTLRRGLRLGMHLLTLLRFRPRRAAFPPGRAVETSSRRLPLYRSKEAALAALEATELIQH